MLAEGVSSPPLQLDLVVQLILAQRLPQVPPERLILRHLEDVPLRLSALDSDLHGGGFQRVQLVIYLPLRPLWPSHSHRHFLASVELVQVFAAQRFAESFWIAAQLSPDGLVPPSMVLGRTLPSSKIMPVGHEQKSFLQRHAEP